MIKIRSLRNNQIYSTEDKKFKMLKIEEFDYYTKFWDNEVK